MTISIEDVKKAMDEEKIKEKMLTEKSKEKVEPEETSSEKKEHPLEELEKFVADQKEEEEENFL